MTPLIGQTLVQAGYDAEYSLKPGKLTTPPEWDEVLKYNFPNLTLKKPALLDFGAVGKGYLVDIIGELLESQGVASFCINAGGDILYKTATGVKLDVALEHPANPDMGIGVAHLKNQSLCGSAANRRAWVDFHHIINPATLTSPKELSAVWVVADSGLLADALTTALFFVDQSVLQKHFDFAYALVSEDMSLAHSANFPAVFFTDYNT
jgi:thiamine biosynthesis lipoprotein